MPPASVGLRIRRLPLRLALVAAALVGLAAPSPAQTPVVTRGPYLQLGTSTSVRVRWRTDLATDSRVRFGPSPAALSSTVGDPALVAEHELEVPGLSPSTRYYYVIGASTGVQLPPDSVKSFVTSPPSGTARPTRIWVIGDSGLPQQDARDVRDAYAGYAPARHTDLWLMLGDNAYGSGTDAEYQAAVFDMYPDLLAGSVLWPTLGNHDLLYAGANNDYLDLFTLPAGGQAGGVPSGVEKYYSFDFGDVHFICLDSQTSSRNPAGLMMTWLQTDIAASTALWNIAYWHHPPYTKSSNDSDDPMDSEGKMRDMRMIALPILEAGGVDLVLSGHSHTYERSFLLDGHYGTSGTLTGSMILDGGDGRIGGDGPYVKTTLGRAPNEGAVYAVVGSSSRIDAGPLNHPVMVSSLAVLGSLVIDIHGPRLDGRFITHTGAVQDSFTIIKGAAFVSADPGPNPAPGPRLALAGGNPSVAETRLRYGLPEPGRARIEVLDISGRRLATLLDGHQPPGTGEVTWDGGDARGRMAPDGIYFAVLSAAGERRVARIVRAR